MGLLQLSREGDRQAEHRLTELLYPELRRLAGRRMRRERPGHTLQTTALIHEAYIRMANGPALDFDNRSQLLGFASHVMRNLLVDHSRLKAAERRGGPLKQKVSEDVLHFDARESQEDILAVHHALEALSEEDVRSARAMEGYFFGGLTIEELAAWLDVSTRTVKRDLAFAKAWMYRRFVPSPG